MVPISVEADECDFIAMLAQGGTFIHEVPTGADVYFNSLQNQSCPPNVDGYGIVYYDTDPLMSAEQRFYAEDDPNPNNDIYFGHFDNGVMTQARNTIQDVEEPVNATIVLGHDREGTGGQGNHPFWLDWEGRTYTLVHNGGISGTMKQNFLSGLLNSGWFQDHDSNWYGIESHGSVDTWIDSELWFHYLMSYINQEDGDVLSAIFAALNEDNFLVGAGTYYDVRADIMSSNSTVNFVLSDGESLYLFRDASDTGHQMSLTRHETSGLMGVTTDNSGTELEQYYLVYLPPSGDEVTYIDAFNYDIYTYDDYTWVCYPLLPTLTGPATSDHFNQIEPLINHMRVLHEDENPAIWQYGDWTLGEIDNIVSTMGYKVKILDNGFEECEHIVSGEQLINPVSFVTLHNGINYVPYFLEGSQHPSEAFPSNVLDNMLSIEAEDWFMVRINGEFYVKKKCPPVTEPEYVECFTLHYGAMYMLNMSLFEPIDFIYHQPETPLDLFVLPTPEYFTFDDGEDYLMVVIEEIENGEDVIEIGAMQNGICVGAEVVDGYPINLRVYAENLDGVTYEVIHDDPLYRTVPGEPAPPVRRTLAPAARRYINGATLLELTDITDLYTAQPSAFSAVSATPNPFNPSTEISFLLNRTSDVSLKVYNIQGQLVSTLLQGSLESGVYSCSWNGSSDRGNPVASGIYYFQLGNGTEQISGKLILLK
ncbi:MAG: T9SS type A sorting domain-containing protein [Candidatus Delongbacteria bacterium]|nr:T9SS type A sorting domain-containing protein [Candidatus Delongbacteria bacterium]